MRLSHEDPVRRQGPEYDLAEVVRLARSGRVLLTKRVTAWLDNHGYDAAGMVVELLERLPGLFSKGRKREKEDHDWQDHLSLILFSSSLIPS